MPKKSNGNPKIEAPMLDPVTRKITVPCGQRKAFEIFVDMGKWWPLEKRSMSLMQAKRPAKSLMVDPREGGQIIEHAADGVEHHWGTFRMFSPHDHVQMDFHMGLPPEQTGQVDVHFKPLSATETEVTLIHSNWEGYGDMADMMLNGYGSSWEMLFDTAYGAACR